MTRKGIERERQCLHCRLAYIDAVVLERQDIAVTVADLDLLVGIDDGLGALQEAKIERLGELSGHGQGGRSTTLYERGFDRTSSRQFRPLPRAPRR